MACLVRVLEGRLAVMDFLSGYAAFHWVATWAHPSLDVFFRIVTDLGSHATYFVVCAPLFWVVDRRRASVLFLLVLFSAYINTFAKLGFNTPRPDPTLARVMDLRPFQSNSPSFPSGHTQGAIVFWSFVALWARRRWVSVLAAVMMILVGFSRIYLGAHFPIDVLGGVVLALFSLRWLWPPLHRWVEADFPASAPWLLPVVIAAIASALLTHDSSLALLGGCLVGFVASTAWLAPAPEIVAGPKQRALAATLGAVVLLPIATLIEQTSGNDLLLLGSVGVMWVLTLWVYPHALARLVSRQAAVAELESRE